MNIYTLGNGAYRQGHPLVIALGNFDGVHTGHAALLKYAVNESRKIGGSSAVWTFERRSDCTSPYLTDKDEKLRLFRNLGIEYAVFEDLETVRKLSPEEFVKDILIKKLGCVKAVCGFNFRFGYMGAGNPETLSSLIDAEVIPPVEISGEAVSSTRIRSAVESGDMPLAGRMLGRMYSIELEVVGGNHVGHKIGIPTINQIFPPSRAVPLKGVYISKTILNGIEYRSITNVGTRPTVTGNSDSVVCETHIIGFDGDLYGKTVKVEFYRYRRGEHKFDTIDELKNVIGLDIKASMEFNYNEKQNY